MKEKVICYSKTGNTLSVARRLSESLGISCEEVKAYVDEKKQTLVSMIEIPSLDGVSRVYFGSPVHGFQMPVATKGYLGTFDSFEGIEFVLFVTHFFPFSWLGGNQTLNQMKKLITDKGGKVIDQISVNWKSRKKEETINHLIKTYTRR